MKDPAFKAQLFRFIDVLPALQDDSQVVRLAEEYFGEMGAHLFGAQWGLRALGATLSGKAIRHQVEQMAGSFIAGASIEQAVPTLRKLWEDGRTFSVNRLTACLHVSMFDLIHGALTLTSGREPDIG
ncbi:MAG: hypothetical protein AABZ34_01180 [Nitrospirota bacterium]